MRSNEWPFGLLPQYEAIAQQRWDGTSCSCGQGGQQLWVWNWLRGTYVQLPSDDAKAFVLLSLQ